MAFKCSNVIAEEIIKARQIMRDPKKLKTWHVQMAHPNKELSIADQIIAGILLEKRTNDTK